MRILPSMIVALALLGPVAAQPGMPSGGDCGAHGASGPSSLPGATPNVYVPGDGPDRDGGRGEGDTASEAPVGDFNAWLGQNPDSPLANLAQQAVDDSSLRGVLDQLTPAELENLGGLLTTYQNHINTYIANNPRTWDTAPGGLRNMLNSMSTPFGGSAWVRGCADMQSQTTTCLAPHTGGSNPFTVHPYNWVPGLGRQGVIYFGAPVAAIAGVKAAGAGTALAGPAGTVVGGAIGVAIAVGSQSTEHNMVVLQSTRDNNLIVVLDPHAAQHGNAGSVHGPDHHSDITGRPSIGPPTTPPRPTAVRRGPALDRGSLGP